MKDFEEQLLKAADEILLLIKNQSFNNHFAFGTGRPIALKPTSRSGGLVAAMARSTTRGDRATVTMTPTGMEIIGEIRKTEYPYALLIHEGGSRPVTSAMRRFFWAKWHQTRTKVGTGSVENQMWSNLRFSNIISYAPRPFLINAVMEVASEIPEVLSKYAFRGLQIEIEKIIAGTGTKL